MNILTFVLGLSKGGTERVAQNFAEAYLELNHDSRIVCYDLGPRADELKDKIEVVLYRDFSIDSWIPDIVHLHSLHLKENDVRALITTAKARNPNLVVVETNVFSTPSAWEDSLDYSFQLSQWTNWLYKLRGGDLTKARILPNSVKTGGFFEDTTGVAELKAKLNIPEDAFVLGRIGQSYNGKWSTTLLTLFEKLVAYNEKFYLVLVNPTQKVQACAAASPCKARIVIIDSVIGDDNLRALYNLFDLFVLIADSGESFGMVITESILCATPVITLHTPWADNSQGEVVNNGVGGFVCNSFAAMFAIIVKYFENPNILTMEKGIASIKNRFDNKKLARQVIDIAENKNTSSADNFSPQQYLNNAYDNANWLTLLLLKTNNKQLRLFTQFTTGHSRIIHLPGFIWSMIRG